MPLEPCPVCGYALSIHDHHCRHCDSALQALPSPLFAAKHLPRIIVALALASVLVYLIFFR